MLTSKAPLPMGGQEVDAVWQTATKCSTKEQFLFPEVTLPLHGLMHQVCCGVRWMNLGKLVYIGGFINRPEEQGQCCSPITMRHDGHKVFQHGIVVPLRPLAWCLDTWIALPIPSRLLLRPIRLSYAIQFARRLPKFSGVISPLYEERMLLSFERRLLSF